MPPYQRLIDAGFHTGLAIVLSVRALNMEALGAWRYAWVIVFWLIATYQLAKQEPMPWWPKAPKSHDVGPDT